ncbi:hypothetical protein ACOMHN_021232 [Nucella lapillus]
MCRRFDTQIHEEAVVYSASQSGDQDFIQKLEKERHRIQADVYNIGIVITQCLTPEGRMENRLSADTMTLIVVKKCPLTSFIRHLTKLRDNLPGIDQFDFVDMREVVSLQLALTTPDTQKQHWYVNSDGETVSLTSALCYFRLHPRVFRVFGPRTVSRAC